MNVRIYIGSLKSALWGPPWMEYSKFGLIDQENLIHIRPQLSEYIHCVHEKVTPQTMRDRNVKSEYILIKLCALVFEYICERTTKFHEKILFDSGVTVLIFKYR